MYNYCLLFITFFIYSVIGYITEVSCVSIRSKKLVLSRGFLIGPYLPIFGIGGLFMSLFLTKYDKSLIELFVMSMTSCLTIEYIGSLLLEKIFKLRWWDYSNKKYNINGRICLETGILFGLGGIVVVKLINPLLNSLLLSIPKPIIILIGIILSLIFITDLIISINITYNFKINFEKYNNKDATEEIRRLIRDELARKHSLTYRLLNSFPNAKDKQHHKIIQLIKRQKN